MYAAPNKFLQPVVAVGAAPSSPELNEPWPDFTSRPVDGQGVGPCEFWLADKAVAGHTVRSSTSVTPQRVIAARIFLTSAATSVATTATVHGDVFGRRVIARDRLARRSPREQDAEEQRPERGEAG
jgi:hypothetical protein